MAARLSEPLTIQDVAAALGIGPRRLQLAFQAVRERSPREALSEMRLSAARRRLLAPDAGDTVSTVALDRGVAHFGRFASAYKAMFGESPSQTLRRA